MDGVILNGGKKKRVNRSAKLKQSKLDVRREQWLSQVKNKGSKEENKGAFGAKVAVSDMHDGSEGGRGVAIAKLVINSVGEENEGLLMSDDWDSPSNSPTSNMSSSLASNRSVINFAGSSSRSSSSSSGGCFYSDMTEEDDGDGDDGCLDDWEAIADALAAEDVKNDCENKTMENENETETENGAQLSFESETERVKEGVEDREKVNCRAWRPDDAYRPQGLPNLLKQNSFPMNSDRHYCGGTVWGFKSVGMALAPLTCPICCEDLDMTDSSFLPCPCGYRLCLFCYKRILEDNGRCPGCRKQYEQPDQGNANAASKMARSYSMIARR